MAFITSLPKDQTDKVAQNVYGQFEQQTGHVPEWVKVMAHCPQVLKEFTELFKAVMGEGKIEKELKWKIAYLVSKTLKCEFCVDVTEKMLKKLGAGDEMLEQIKNMDSLDEEERQILDLVKDVTLDGHLDKPEIFEQLKDKLSEAELVEIVSVIGLFNYINRFNNTFSILPE